MNTQNLNKEMSVYDLAIMMMEGFENADKRFDKIENRFDILEKRVNALEENMVTKDEFIEAISALNKKIDRVTQHYEARFDTMENRLTKAFI